MQAVQSKYFMSVLARHADSVNGGHLLGKAMKRKRGGSFLMDCFLTDEKTAKFVYL